MARILRVGLEYDAPPARARAELEAAVRDLPGLAAYPPPQAGLHEFGDFAVIYELRYWLEDYARYMEIDGAVRERVWYGLERAGLAIAYPAHPPAPVRGRPLRRPRRRRGPRREAIERGELFAPLSSEERGQLAARRSPAAVRRRARSSSAKASTTSSMFLIAEGRVADLGARRGRASQKVAVLEPGSAFGEISLLTGEPRLATARAVTESTLIEIDKDTLAPLLRGQSLPRREARRDHPGAPAPDGRPPRRRAATGSPPTSPNRSATKIARFFGLKGLTG